MPNASLLFFERSPAEAFIDGDDAIDGCGAHFQRHIAFFFYFARKLIELLLLLLLFLRHGPADCAL